VDAIGGQPSDQQFLRAQHVQRADCPGQAPLAGGGKFLASSFSPRHRGEGIEGVPGGAQGLARLTDPVRRRSHAP
jgi:hypothetical protein